MPQALKVLDSCTFTGQSNDRENAFVFPQFPLIKFHGRAITSNEFLLGAVYTCMIITYSKGKDQPGKVANPARGQLNRENAFFLASFRA